MASASPMTIAVSFHEYQKHTCLHLLRTHNVGSTKAMNTSRHFNIGGYALRACTTTTELRAEYSYIVRVMRSAGIGWVHNTTCDDTVSQVDTTWPRGWHYRIPIPHQRPITSYRLKPPRQAFRHRRKHNAWLKFPLSSFSGVSSVVLLIAIS